MEYMVDWIINPRMSLAIAYIMGIIFGYIWGWSSNKTKGDN